MDSNIATPVNPLEAEEKPTLEIPLPDGSNEQISIIVVHHDRPEYLNICLQSIHIMSDYNNFEVIVVDNASSQETQDYLDVIEEEGVKVIRNQENKYWSAAANQGAAMADKNSKYLLFLHCDTVVLNQAWLELLINISGANQSGLVGTQMESYLIQKRKSDFIKEWCLMFTRECWEDCGPWPEELPVIGNAFIMTLRAQTKGYKPMAITNQIVHHYKAFSYTAEVFNAESEKSMAVIPNLMQQAQS